MSLEANCLKFIYKIRDNKMKAKLDFGLFTSEVIPLFILARIS
jgi:hypothetical protein